MSAVLLDASPLGIRSNPRFTSATTACRQWLQRMIAANHRVLLPEITDYEVRRELIRCGQARSVARLDRLAKKTEYLPLTTAARRLAAEWWAQVRQQGLPTAGNDALDADVILAAQALTLGVPVIVATANVGHLARFVPADLWHNIIP